MPDKITLSPPFPSPTGLKPWKAKATNALRLADLKIVRAEFHTKLTMTTTVLDMKVD